MLTLAARAFALLVTWPDLAEVEPSCGTGRALGCAQGEIAHFHSGRHFDLHLTARGVRRFREDLEATTAVRTVSGSPWVTVRLEVATDVDLLMTLVSLALQAHQAWPVPAQDPPTMCNDRRNGVLPHGHLGTD
ncbi:luciferase domain-containing protein [Streptomyces sp. YIM S03343]